jgi:hypothetical protein
MGGLKSGNPNPPGAIMKTVELFKESCITEAARAARVTLDAPKKYASIVVRYELLDVQRASALLATVDTTLPQRKMNLANKAKLVRAMLNDEFRTTGDCVCIDPWGRMWNGQHRLTAIVETGKSQWMLVVYGLIDHIGQDIGAKRTVADFLVKYSGFSKGAAKKAVPRIKQYHSIVNGGTLASEVETLDLVQANIELLGWADRTFPLDKAFQMAPIVAAFMVAYEANPTKTNTLAAAYVDCGADLPQRGALRQLRKWLENNHEPEGRGRKGTKALIRQAEYRDRTISALAYELRGIPKNIAPVKSEENKGYLLDLRSANLLAKAA